MELTTQRLRLARKPLRTAHCYETQASYALLLLLLLLRSSPQAQAEVFSLPPTSGELSRIRAYDKNHAALAPVPAPKDPASAPIYSKIEAAKNWGVTTNRFQMASRYQAMVQEVKKLPNPAERRFWSEHFGTLSQLTETGSYHPQHPEGYPAEKPLSRLQKKPTGAFFKPLATTEINRLRAFTQDHVPVQGQRRSQDPMSANLYAKIEESKTWDVATNRALLTRHYQKMADEVEGFPRESERTFWLDHFNTLARITETGVYHPEYLSPPPPKNLPTTAGTAAQKPQKTLTWAPGQQLEQVQEIPAENAGRKVGD